VERLYHVEAIKSVTERMTEGQRRFLLVMATGTGKTRTVIALIDLLMRAKWVQRVIFLADRRELVRQALDDFKEHMPDETRTRVEGGEIDPTAHIHVATYPSMMQVYVQRQGFAQVIDNQMERAEQVLDDFKHKDWPRVAVSVNMLDTGIDVPAIQNLVFAKPVFSQVKFW
jgi:type I site-specific restriction endonuclease